MKTKITIAAIALTGALTLLAGEGDAPDQRPPAPPLIAALDANRDGVIDANEIANAANALLTLDKNGDGQLTVEEFRPHPPGPRGPRGPRGEGSRGPRN